MLKIGSIEKTGEEYVIHREFYRQGMIFKDEEAYRFHPDKPCYTPELSDSVYTAENFKDMCNGQQEFADDLFESVDWQHPESLLEENFVNNEWVVCEQCGNLINYGTGCDDKNCSKCGWEVMVNESAD